MIVYGSSISPFARKVLVALAEKGVAYEHVPLRFHDPDPAFQAASPLGKIPAIDDDGFRLADSSAILRYLEAKHPAPAIIPTEARALGRAVWFEKFGDTELIPKLAVPFVQRFLLPKVMGKPGDEAAVEKAMTKDLPRLFDYLEGEIAGPYLVGDAFGIADIAITTGFHNLRLVELGVEAGRWPRLAAYVDATLARPSFAAAIAARRG